MKKKKKRVHAILYSNRKAPNSHVKNPEVSIAMIGLSLAKVAGLIQNRPRIYVQLCISITIDFSGKVDVMRTDHDTRHPSLGMCV